MSVYLSNQLFLLSVLAFYLILNTYTMESPIVSVTFEVFGRVQGVFFRKYTQKQAKQLGLVGYCMNTEKGTVQGTMEGPPEKISVMKKWLQEVGSPSSRIERAIFSSEMPIKKPTSQEFIIKR